MVKRRVSIFNKVTDKRYFSKRLVFLLLIIFAFAIIFFLFKSSPPQILSASVYPTKVRPGEVMLVTVAVKGSVSSVTAENTHNLGKDKINLQLKKIENGTRIYEGSWIVHDTTGQLPYRTYVTVAGKLGQIAEERVEWLDPTVTHSASQVTAGTFGAGDYVFPSNITINNTLTINSTILLKPESNPANQTGYAKIYYKSNDIDSYAKLLIHFDGADAATAYTAETGQTVTFVGTAQLDTAQYKFGSASLLLDGNSDWVTVPDSADWSFGTGDFTIDMWVRFADLTTHLGIIAHTDGTPGNYGWWIYWYQPSSAFQFVYSTDGTAQASFSFATTLSINTWYHLAFTRNGANLRMFLDGALIGTGNIGTNNVFDSTATSAIGKDTYDTLYTNGWIDEVRVSKGIARWTSTFTPPSLAYSAGGLYFQYQNGTAKLLAGE